VHIDVTEETHAFQPSQDQEVCPGDELLPLFIFIAIENVQPFQTMRILNKN
jgi:hypothetical protein